MIHLDNISLSYGSRTILREASLHLAAGELCALVGRNGAGKSTLLKALTSRGDVRIAGAPLAELSAEQMAQTVAMTETTRNTARMGVAAEALPRM